MRKTLIATAVAAAVSLPTFALAQAAAAAPASPHTFTGNVGLASEYLYRGIAQTRGKPALQGGFDYAHASGVYAGVWGSNVSWLDDIGASASLELDIYGGYKGAINSDLGYDVGILTYNYPGTNKPSGAAKPDTVEVYGALTYKWITVKYSHSTGSLFGWTTSSNGKTRGSGYLEVNGAYDLGSGWGLTGHIGHQKVKGFGDASYTDYKLGVTKDLGVGVLGLAVSATDANDSCGSAQAYCFVAANSGSQYSAGKTRGVVTFTKSF